MIIDWQCIAFPIPFRKVINLIRSVDMKKFRIKGRSLFCPRFQCNETCDGFSETGAIVLASTCALSFLG